MDIKDKVKRVLERLDVADPVVEVLDGYGYRVVARVVSRSFEGMPDGERQHLVWARLLDELGEREQEWVEYIFTKSPSEVVAAGAASRGSPTPDHP